MRGLVSSITSASTRFSNSDWPCSACSIPPPGSPPTSWTPRSLSVIGSSILLGASTPVRSCFKAHEAPRRHAKAHTVSARERHLGHADGRGAGLKRSPVGPVQEHRDGRPLEHHL